MDSYFFVPGTRLHKVTDIQKLNVSEIIIDLEDAVKVSERSTILEKLITNEFYKNFYVRIPMYNELEKLDNSLLTELYNNGFRKFVFPKIQKAADFENIISGKKFQSLQVILLVETTRFFLEVKETLLRYESLFSGIGVGSHDFMSEVGGVHNLNNLEYVRQHILYLARMIDIPAIDIASMELKNDNILKEEIIDGVHKGYDAKFFIHPWQIDTFKSISLYSKAELDWAREVYKEFKKVNNKAEFSPVVIDGEIIERPHLNKAKKIIKHYEAK